MLSIVLHFYNLKIVFIGFLLVFLPSCLCIPYIFDLSFLGRLGYDEDLEGRNVT